MEKLLVVDGSNLLFQMFYGMPSRIVNRQGHPIQGTLGFLGALLKMCRWLEATHVAVLFDGECTNPRTELDPEYKADRPDLSLLPEEDTPFFQLPDIEAALDFLHIFRRETTECEADDWIAACAGLAGPDREVIIASQDSDFFQLIGTHVKVFRYRSDSSVLCDDTYLREKFGIVPEQYAAWKSLTGDHADNIRGIDKVGPKTATALLQQFGTMDALLENTDRIAKPSVRQAVQQQIDRIRTNYRLICLQQTAVLPFSAEQMRFSDPGLSTTAVLQAIGLR